MNFGQSVIDTALQYQGTPYAWGGTNNSGIDCSGLVQQVYGRLGVQLPRTTYEQVNMGTPVADLSQAQPGDLVFLHPSQAGPGHVGIYVGNGLMIDANHTGGSVGIRSLNGYGPVVAIRRVVQGGDTGVNLPPLASQAGAAGALPQGIDHKSALDVVAGMLGAPPAQDMAASKTDLMSSPTNDPNNPVASPTPTTTAAPEDPMGLSPPQPKQDPLVQQQIARGGMQPVTPGPDVGPGGDLDAQLKAGFTAGGRPDLASMVGTAAFNKWVNAESGGNPTEVSAANNQGLPNGGIFQFWAGHDWAKPYFENGKFTASPYQQAYLAATQFSHLSPQAIQGYAAQIDAGRYRGWG